MENRKWKLKLTLLLVSSLTIMSVITISPALPEMAAMFSEVANAPLLVKVVLTIPALMIALFSPVTGWFIDRHGRLNILSISLFVYGISGAAGFFLDNLYHILVSRIFLGISVGISMTIVITLIADYFDGIGRQKFVGLQIAFMSLGGILFTGLGGILADIGWRYPFLIYLFSLVVLPFTMRFLHEPVVAAKPQRGEIRIKPPSVILVLFFNTMFMWVIFFLIPVQIPFYLKRLGTEENALIGAAIATSTAFSAISSFFYSRIKSRYSFLFIFFIGYLLMAAGFFCIAIAGNYFTVLVAMMLSGLGIGLMIPNTNMWVMKIVPPEVRGREIGKLTTFWFLGQFLSPLILFPALKVLSLPSAFMLAAALLLLVSMGFLIFHFSKTGKLVTPEA
jgi:MFS family permease